MLDDLRWSWCNTNRNKVHNKCHALESSPNHLPTPSVKKLSSMKLVSDAKKLGDQFLLFFSHSFMSALMSDSLQPHGLQHVRPPCPSLSPRVYSNPCPLSRWCHPTISSSVTPFSSCPQSFPISESFPMSQLFASGGQSIGASASASVLPMNIKDDFL